MSQQIEIGRVLRAGTAGFIVGCRVNQLDSPGFGALVRAPLSETYQVYGLIHDIRIDDDGFVRQLVTAEAVSNEVLLDNRERRIVPIEISVLTVGFQQDGQVNHLLPPRPPLSLDAIYLCSRPEIARFTAAGRFGYLRHILRAPDLPIGELLAAHIRQARAAHEDGDKWMDAAVKETIALLRDDYALLTSVLGSLNEVASVS